MSTAILGGWYYPSAPCWPNLDLVEKFKGMNQLCGEFLRFSNNTQQDGSCIEIMHESHYGNGGYSPEHIEKLQQVVSQPYCTISGRAETGVIRMLEDNGDLQLKTIEKIVNFCKSNKLGADMNIEGLAAFSVEECHKHIEFLDQLGKALKAENIKYRVVTVAEDGTLFHGNWRNDFLRDVTCDYIVCMQYDRMYDYGRVGVSPIEFLKQTTINIKRSIGPSWPEKYICGLPNYGYKAYQDNNYWIELVTKGQLAKKGITVLPGSRDPDSFEMTWEGNDVVRNKPAGPIYYFYNDQKALDEKTKIMLKLGVNKFSLWHIFGVKDSRDTTYYNPWWSDEVLSQINENPIDPINPVEPINPPPLEPVLPTDMEVIMFTGDNMGGLSKRYRAGQHNLYGDDLIKPNKIKEMTVNGQGKIILYDNVFEDVLYTFENKSDARQHIQLGANADKVDSFVITAIGDSALPPVEPEPVEPIPEPIPIEPIPIEPEPIEPIPDNFTIAELEKIKLLVDNLLDTLKN